MVTGFVDAFLDIQPDLVLVLGDRGEMLAAALSALHLNIPVAHIHGGERSGTIDESIRHAISKPRTSILCRPMDRATAWCAWASKPPTST